MPIETSTEEPLMNRMTTRLLSFFSVFVPLVFLSSCTGTDSVDFESYVKVEINEFLDGEDAQIASISIVDKSQVYQYHLGKLSNGNSPNNQTIYELASITKTYTGLLLANAVVDKKVEPDTDIRRYLTKKHYSNLALSGKYITLRHLATHTSGLPKDLAYSGEDVKKGLVIDKMSNYSQDKFFNDLGKLELLSVPGKQYRYSNAGTKLVAYILESVYNKPFELLIAETITAKSGELHTKFQRIERGLDDVTTGTNQFGIQMPLLSPYGWAEGGLTSTVQSITSFMRYQLSSENPEVSLSHTFLAGVREANGRAFFWNTFEYDSEDQMLYHSGGSLGTSSWLALYPKKNIGIFIVTNTSAGNTQGQLNELSNKIYDKLITYKTNNKIQTSRLEL